MSERRVRAEPRVEEGFRCECPTCMVPSSPMVWCSLVASRPPLLRCSGWDPSSMPPGEEAATCSCLRRSSTCQQVENVEASEG